MEFFGMLDGGFEAFAFFCQDVDEDGHVAMLREFEILLERVEIVAVNGAEVAETKLLEERRLDEEVLGLALPFGVNAVHFYPGREALEEGLDVVMELVVDRVGADAVQVTGNGADIFCDRPLIVVEDHDQAFRGGDDVVEGFEGNAAGEGRIAADRDHVFS